MLAKEILLSMKEKFHFELYPIATLSEWKWIARNSVLYSSDIFYSIPVYGNSDLYRELLDWLSSNDVDSANQRIYFLYNYLYRNRQLSKQMHSSSLKYKKGGVRDFQLLKWLAVRVFSNYDYLPIDYLRPLYLNGWILISEYSALVRYCEEILAAKWELEEGLGVCEHQILLDEIIPESIRIVDKIKEKAFCGYFPDINISYITDSRKSREYLLSKCEIYSKCSIFEEMTAFIKAWFSSTRNEIRELARTYSSFFSVRAALSLNASIDSEMLMDLFRLNYIDMDDIKCFIKKHRRFDRKGM